ncbi:MAG TPA: glycosyltransferase family 8 protein [Clostridiaceae bacterium]|nr:glycosyltransferase family 8 protein [Clostridiaceae bacterium]
MDILVTLNSKYIKPLKVMLKSLFLNNPDESFSIYLMYSNINDEELENLDSYIKMNKSDLKIVSVDDSYFKNAPILRHYTKEMYYRLLAFKFLPDELERILYLDPDILVINPINKLYNIDIKGYLYAAACHNKISVREINRIRWSPYDIDAYYNSGVLLMNLELQRQTIDEQSIYDFVEKNRLKLIMPDQDILNALYSKKIKSIDERLYNYDARYYTYYKIMSNGACDMDYVINNTAILHFCGKRKPWEKDYSGKFHSLYKHYEKLALKGTV